MIASPAELGRLCKQAVDPLNQNPYLPFGGLSRPSAPQQPFGHGLGQFFGNSMNASQPAPAKPSWLSQIGSTLAKPFKTYEAQPGAWKQTPRGVENNWWQAGQGATTAVSFVPTPLTIGGGIASGLGLSYLQNKHAPQPEATTNGWWFYNPERFRHEQGYGPERGAQNNWYSALGRVAGRMTGPVLPLLTGDTTGMSAISHPIRLALNSVPMSLSRPSEQAKAWWQGRKLPYSAAEVIDPLYARQ